MQHRLEKKNKALITAAVLLVLALVSFMCIRSLIAGYKAETGSSDSARVAVFGHDESITVPAAILEKLVPGSSATYAVELSNASDSRTSEVAQKYQIEVKTSGNLPLEYTLKKDGSKAGSFSETDTASHVFTDDSMSFKASAAETHKYELVISWPEDRKDIGFSGVPDFVDIDINVEQMD